MNHNTQTTTWTRPPSVASSSSSMSASSSISSPTDAYSSSYGGGGSMYGGAPSSPSSSFIGGGNNGPVPQFGPSPYGSPPSVGGSSSSSSFNMPASLAEAKPLWLERKADAQITETSCSQCNTQFGQLLNRRQYCRCCFRSFCDAHSSKVIAVPQFEHKSPVRVCDACHRHLQRNEPQCIAKLAPYLRLSGGRDPMALRAVDELYNIVQRTPAAADDVLESNVVPALVWLLSLIDAPDAMMTRQIVQHTARALATMADRDG